MMRRFLVGLAILTSGVVGLLGAAWLGELLTNRVLGSWNSGADWAPLMWVLKMVPVVLPPLLVAWVLLPRGRTTEVGLFLLGWGFLWPMTIALWAFWVVARLLGGEVPSMSLSDDPGSIFLYHFFGLLPLAGLWFLSAGLRGRRSARAVSQG